MDTVSEYCLTYAIFRAYYVAGFKSLLFLFDTNEQLRIALAAALLKLTLMASEVRLRQAV